VSFTTIYPGWYSGRTIHVHVRIRMFSGTTTTFNFETQLLFDDTLSNQVLALPAYSRSGTRDTTDATDRVYTTEAAEHGVNLPVITGDLTSGLVGTYSAVVTAASDGSVDGGGGVPGGGMGPGGTPPSMVPVTTTTPTGTTTTTTTTTTTVADTTVLAGLAKLKWTRTSTGLRELTATITAKETVTTTGRLTKGSKVLVHGSSLMKTGSRTLKLTLSKGISKGKATLTLTLKDAAGNVKTVREVVTVPKG
jgi:hypothetical protein